MATTPDCLATLRHFNIQRKKIVEKDDLIVFDQLAWKKNSLTNYRIYEGSHTSTEVKYYTLESILYLLKNAPLPNPRYIANATALNIQVVRLPDKREMLQYLNGKTETASSIDNWATTKDNLKRLYQPSRASVKRPYALSESQSEPKRHKLQPDGKEGDTREMRAKSSATKPEDQPSIMGVISMEKIATIRQKIKAKAQTSRSNKHIKDDLEVDQSKVTEANPSQYTHKEIQCRTRNSVLQSTGKSFGNVLTMLKSMKLEERVETVEANRKPPVPSSSKAYNRFEQEKMHKGMQQSLGFHIDTTATNLSHRVLPSNTGNKLNTSKLPGKSNRKSRTPIIIVPNVPSANITMWNAKEIIQDSKFVSTSDKKTAGNKKQTEVIALRKKTGRIKGDTISTPYLLTDNPAKLSLEDWERVVAVFVAGQSWQFKGWPFDMDNGNPVNILAKIKGFHLHFRESAVDRNILKWNVQVLTVSKHSRHQDKLAMKIFWETLDEFMVKKFPHLRF